MSEKDEIRWNQRHAEASPSMQPPLAWLLSLADQLPKRGSALDVAGGRGRHALWLAQHGLDTTLVDVSDVALGLASSHAARLGSPLKTRCLDLGRDGLPAGPWDLIVNVDFLMRPVLTGYGTVLAPGGLLCVSHPTVRNLERHARPSERFLLQESELPGLVCGLELVEYSEAWRQDGRHTARLLARRP